MDSTTAPIIEKIKKLLALANSSNEHEAALAASHAQRLLSEHNLAMADIEAANKPDKADRVETTLSKTLPKWLRHLSAGVSSAFDCRTVHYPSTGKMTFIGVGADVQIAAYTFVYLNRTVRRLCGSYMKHNVSPALANRHSELMRQSYYLGAVSTITTRLKVQKFQTPITSGALVPVKEGLITQAMNEIGNLRTVRSRKSYIHPDAYTTGQDDGRRVGINKGIGGGATNKTIPR
jgi:hypothetical protein